MKKLFQILTVFIAVAALVQTIAIAAGKNASLGKEKGSILKDKGIRSILKGKEGEPGV